MVYLTGTLTNINAPATLYADIAAALVTVGYTQVDTFTATTDTVVVWKSAAAGNAANLDWHLVVIYTTSGAGRIDFTASEGWDVASHRALRPITHSDGSTWNGGGGENYSYLDAVTNGRIGYDVATGSRFGATLQTLHSPPAYAGYINVRQLSAPSTAFGYWISITANRVCYVATGAATTGYYVGLYEPSATYVNAAAVSGYPAGAFIFPLISVGMTADNGLSLYNDRRAGVSRIGGFPGHFRGNAGAGPQDDGNWSGIIRISPGYGGNTKRTPSLTQNGAWVLPGYNDVGAGAQRPIVELNMRASSFTMPLGLLHDCYLLPVDAAVSRGDTVTIAGNNHFLTSSSANMAWAFRAF